MPEARGRQMNGPKLTRNGTFTGWLRSYQRRWCAMTRISGRCYFAAAMLATVVIGGGGIASGQGKPGKSDGDSDAGIRLRLQASEKEIGLPVYPGAKQHKDNDNESAAANFGVWGKTFGLRLVVLKMESADTPAKVAAFYQKALDCSDGTKKSEDSSAKKSPDTITCDDTPETGAMIFKSGTRGKQHIVGIQANGQGSVFQLVMVDKRGIDTDEKPQ